MGDTATVSRSSLIRRPNYDGSMLTMERIVADIVATFDQMRGLIRHGLANTDQPNATRAICPKFLFVHV